METAQLLQRIALLEEENGKMKERFIMLERKVVEIENNYAKRIDTMEREKRVAEEIRNLRDEDYEGMKNEMAVIRLEYEMIKLQIEDKKNTVTENGNFKRRRTDKATEEKNLREDEADGGAVNVPSIEMSEEEDMDRIEKYKSKDRDLEEDIFDYRIVVKGGNKGGKLDKWIEEIGLGAWKIEWINGDTGVLWMKEKEDYVWMIENKDSINRAGTFAVERYLNAEEKMRKRKIYEHVSEVKRGLEREGVRKKAVFGDDWAKFNGWLYLYDERTGMVRRDRRIGENEWLQR